jgi:hypothetical protein
MIDKKYLDKLKEEDYIAWDDLVNDPMVVGQNTESSLGSVFLFIVLIVSVVLIFSYLVN